MILGIFGRRIPKHAVISVSYGAADAPRRVLVAYSSPCGASAKTADNIGKTMGGADLRVDVRPASEVKDVSGYTAVLIGSAIRFGSFGSAAIRVAKMVPAAIPVGYFSTSGQMAKGGERQIKNVHKWMQKMHTVKEPKYEDGMFAGDMAFETMEPVCRILFLPFRLLRLVKAGARRNPEVEAAWAARVKAAL